MGMYDTAALKMSILDRDATFNQAVAGMWPVKEADPRFLLYAVRYVHPEVLNLRRGVRQKNLSLAKIKAITIRIPETVKEQQSAVEHIAKARAEAKRLKTIDTQKLANLDELKQSLLQKAFNGQLTTKEVAV